ncbi:MAG TPA: type IV toxin-antitoxin system AbiEi family antitoxin domain-containing protein [Dehalococcoidia bacterium]|nr:type IV toxin-antitoxin system AbiEi family antitoxin domain-containing protein [Dehalococcoidia bacterium]
MTDLRGLEAKALLQGGYFDRADALAYGVNDRLLAYHTAAGRFAREFPGVYRLRHAPISLFDDYWRAWVWSNYRGAISHESALLLYDLSDVLPSKVHLTVPLQFNRRAPASYVMHRARLHPDEITIREGISVTAPARTIVDAAAYGTDPEQIQLAVRQALDRALTSEAALRFAAGRAGYRHSRNVRRLLEGAMRPETAHAVS